MKKSISGIAMILLVLVAGCTESDANNTPTSGTNTDGGSSGSSSIGGDAISMTIDGFPTTISNEEELTFSFEILANEALEDVEVLMYDFGSHIESSCSGKNRLGNFVKGERKTRTCTLKVIDNPNSRTSQEMKYEINFKIKSEEADLQLKVFDGVEFERSNPIAGSESKTFENFGEIHMEPKNVEEGNPINFEINLDDQNLVKNSMCKCHIEKMTLEFPRGFVINGLSDWTKKLCGSNYCYSTSNLKAPFNREFTTLISGVTRSNEFYINAKLEGIWKYIAGSKSFTITVNESIE